jgi:cholesterol transport system auxiliary component
MSRRQLLAAMVAASLLTTLWGCGLGSGPAPRQYTLSPAAGFAQGLQPASWSLDVDEPTAPHQIDVSRIALMNGRFQVEYYADVEWTDNAPAMVQLLLIQSFQNSGRLPVVASTHQTLATDFLLLPNLRKFQVEKDAAGVPQATVVLETTLLRMPRREPVASARFEKATPVAADTIGAVATAFNTSLADVMHRVVDWTVQHGSAVERVTVPSDNWSGRPGMPGRSDSRLWPRSSPALGSVASLKTQSTDVAFQSL